MPKAQLSDPDLIDRLRQEWERESPKLDTHAMDVVGRVMLLANRWDSQVQQTLKPFKLTYTDFDILATLRRSGAPYELTPTQLLQSVLLTSGAMTTALARLEDAGLIARIEDPNDRRSKKAGLTRKGVSLAGKAANKRFETAGVQLEKLSEGERRTLTKLLRKML
ncbi:MAG: MarR family winged helix-turn-helix transcriptional regulator [Lysobacterales bacterium]